MKAPLLLQSPASPTPSNSYEPVCPCGRLIIQLAFPGSTLVPPAQLLILSWPLSSQGISFWVLSCPVYLGRISLLYQWRDEFAFLSLVFPEPGTLYILKQEKGGTFLVVQWLRPPSPSAGGPVLIPGQEIGFHMMQLRVHVPQPKIPQAAMKTEVSMCCSEDPVQPNKYFFFFKRGAFLKFQVRKEMDNVCTW